jgi:hypothetical protein
MEVVFGEDINPHISLNKKNDYHYQNFTYCNKFTKKTFT